MAGNIELGNAVMFFGFMLMIFFGATVIWLLVWFVEKKIIQRKN